MNGSCKVKRDFEELDITDCGKNQNSNIIVNQIRWLLNKIRYFMNTHTNKIKI